MIALLFAAGAQLFAPPANPAPSVDCRFDSASLSFAGTPLEQARCLLRRVEAGGSAAAEVDLPPTLAGLIGQRPEIDFVRLAALLRQAHIPLPAASPVSETSDHRRAAYFVIHDTSSPNLGEHPFPRDLDRQERFNDINQFLGKDAVAHLFNDRLGRVSVGHDFEVGWRATKLERAVGEASRGRFLHVENLQPRRSDPQGPAGNDRIGPEPGFTHAQYRTLALLYVLASARLG
ncbi:MAG: hypothetical protein JOZ20_00545, partial [Sphingomonas sp.]|nr:hypothetical protein [Sphingomonas sp.]